MKVIVFTEGFNESCAKQLNFRMKFFMASRPSAKAAYLGSYKSIPRRE